MQKLLRSIIWIRCLEQMDPPSTLSLTLFSSDDSVMPGRQDIMYNLHNFHPRVLRAHVSVCVSIICHVAPYLSGVSGYFRDGLQVYVKQKGMIPCYSKERFCGLFVYLYKLLV